MAEKRWLEGSAVWGGVRDQYRYLLKRELKDVPKISQESTIGWILLNPSTATDKEDDPTIRRCIDFSHRWGYTDMMLGNIFAYRATDPKELRKANKNGIDIIGRDNDFWLAHLFEHSEIIVAGWGTHGVIMNRGLEIAYQFPEMLSLGITKSGEPKHPLYLKSESELVRHSIRVMNQRALRSAVRGEDAPL